MAAIKNLGHLVNFITGIQGVTAGGNAVVNLPVNLRYHSLIFNCTAVNYTGGAGKAITKITGSGTGATGTLSVTNGVPTAITIVSGGSGWNVGDTFTIADTTGTGFVGTVATVTGGPPGALATATVTIAGSPSAVDPVTLLTSVKITVNGINMRDISPANIIAIQKGNGYTPALGELSIFFTEPWRRIIMPNEVTSWDMFGQSNFSVQLGISSAVTSPGLTGVYEFDYERNQRPGPNGQPVPFLQPVAQHQFSYNAVSGRNDVNNLPFSYPIDRVWVKSANDDVYQLEVYQDSNKVMEATTAEISQDLAPFGMNPANGGFDTAYISDPDQRIWKALKCGNSFVTRVYTNSTEALTFVIESLPGAYQA